MRVVQVVNINLYMVMVEVEMVWKMYLNLLSNKRQICMFFTSRIIGVSLLNFVLKTRKSRTNPLLTIHTTLLPHWPMSTSCSSKTHLHEELPWPEGSPHLKRRHTPAPGLTPAHRIPGIPILATGRGWENNQPWLELNRNKNIHSQKMSIPWHWHSWTKGF